jgi:hypothetical protein
VGKGSQNWIARRRRLGGTRGGNSHLADGKTLVGGALGALDIISLIILRLPLARESFFFAGVGHGEASVRGAEALCEAGDEGDVLFLAPDVSVFTSTHAGVFFTDGPTSNLDATRRRTTCALRRIVKTGTARRRSPSYTARV